MEYKKLRDSPAAQFRRACGVKRTTFEKMVEIVRAEEFDFRRLGGRPPKLSVEDQVLMMLEYLREYRTYFHVATNYGISESQCFRIIRRVEDIIVKSRAFALPKRTRVLSDTEITALVVDCTESPVERPRKNSAGTTPARRNAARSSHRS